MSYHIRKCLFFFLSILFSTLSLLELEAHEKFTFDFSRGHDGWVGGFADYPVGDEAFYELQWGWQNLAVSLQIEDQILTKGMILSGNNHSDNLFMYIKRQIKGLKPNHHYELYFSVTIENNIPPGQFGIGGSPGESVFFKVGASEIEPDNIIENGFYRLNVDKGNQSANGKNALTVGTLANPLVNPNNPQFKPKTFSNEPSLRVKTDNKGRLWLFVGTDSGFEGSTLYYIAKIKVTVK